MIIQQNSSSYKMAMGWYGTSKETPQAFSLQNYDDIIYTVYQITQDGTATASYMTKTPAHFNKFTELEWGKCYLIVLRPGADQINIPNFILSTYEGDSNGTITTEANGYERETEGYFYFSKDRMFKYAVYDGYQTYEIDKYMKSIHSAFDLWEKIAKHPDPNYQHEFGIFFVDLVEEYGEDYADVLAMASPEEFDKPSSLWQFGNTFPTYSQVIINIPNLDYMFFVKDQNGVDLYFSTILHELAHAIGLNYYTMNEFQGTPVNSYTDSTDELQKFYYYGDNALREYRTYFPNSGGLVGVPLDDNIPAPRITAHWEEGIGVGSVPRYINGVLHPGLVNGMMTPYAGEEQTPLTKITIGFLEDYGYNVNYDLAGSYESLYSSLSKLKCNQSCSMHKNPQLIRNTKIKRR